MKHISKLLCVILAAAFTVISFPVSDVSAAPLAPLSYMIDTEGNVGTGDFDNDGRLSASDAVRLQKYILKISHNFTDNNMMTADLNLDGKVNVFDYMLMKRCIMNETSNPGITWKISKVLDSDEFREALDKDYIFTSEEEFYGFIDSLYSSQYVVYDIIPGNDPPAEPYSELAAGYAQKYDREFFKNNVLLLKPVLQLECEDILHDISGIYYNGDTFNIDYRRNYDSLRRYENAEVPLFAEVTVPKSLYRGESVSWNYSEKDWELGVDEYSKGPIPFEFENKYASPDEKNVLSVLCKGENSGSVLWQSVTFSINGRGLLAEIINGNMNNFQVEWTDTSALVFFTVGKDTYSYELNFIDNTVSNYEGAVKQSVRKWLFSSDYPKISSVSVSAGCRKLLSENVSISDAGKDYAVPSETIGRIGNPVLIEYKDEVSDAEAVFSCEVNKNIIKKNDVIVLYYDISGSDNVPVPVDIISVDTQNEEIIFKAEKSGVYYLVRKSVYDPVLEKGINGIYEITMNDDYIAERNGTEFCPIFWHVKYGEKSGMTSAKESTDLKKVFEGHSGETCTVCIEALDNDNWYRVSNIIEFEIP